MGTKTERESFAEISRRVRRILRCWHPLSVCASCYEELLQELSTSQWYIPKTSDQLQKRRSNFTPEKIFLLFLFYFKSGDEALSLKLCCQVTDEDFWAAKEKVVPASQRMYVLPSRPLTTELEPLLRRSLDACLDQISRSCPFRFMYNDQP